MAAKKKSVKPKQAGHEDLWAKTPDMVRRFIDLRPDYEQLCNEVAYVLRKRLKEQGIAFASITCRAKSLKSFLEKLKRKTYSDPLNEITDFAGTRVVCLYIDDLDKIQSIIEKEFKVVESIDKLDERNADQFGYLARHFIVKLGGKSSGARYDDLKSLACEIQARTVLQDAWAIIQHHLAYKREAQVPKPILRKLNSLAGLFETADDQFQRVKDDRERYLEYLDTTRGSEEDFHASDLNLDSFKTFLRATYPDRPDELWEGQDKYVFDRIQTKGIDTLGDVLKIIKKHDGAIAKALDRIEKMEGQVLPANTIPYLAFYFEHKPVSMDYGIPSEWRLDETSN